MSREVGKGGRLMCWEGVKGGRVVSREGGRAVSWRDGKGGRIVRRQGWTCWRAVTWQVGKCERRVVRMWQGGKGAARVARWQGGKGARVVRWQGGNGGRVMKWQGGRFLVLFKSGEHRVSPRFHLFVSDVDHPQKEGVG